MGGTVCVLHGWSCMFITCVVLYMYYMGGVVCSLRCTPNPSVIQSMDWLSITSIIDERRLGFFDRILSFVPSSIYKKVAIIRMYQSIFQQTEINIGPTHWTLLAAKKYGLMKTIHQ